MSSFSPSTCRQNRRCSVEHEQDLSLASSSISTTGWQNIIPTPLPPLRPLETRVLALLRRESPSAGRESREVESRVEGTNLLMHDCSRSGGERKERERLKSIGSGRCQEIREPRKQGPTSSTRRDHLHSDASLPLSHPNGSPLFVLPLTGFG